MEFYLEVANSFSSHYRNGDDELFKDIEDVIKFADMKYTDNEVLKIYDSSKGAYRYERLYERVRGKWQTWK